MLIDQFVTAGIKKKLDKTEKKQTSMRHTLTILFVAASVG